ncbi:hypothetical protein [Burkholderia ubonensis]|uniref:hypothetical protein n=1 Tax=Burkholderia ubonensis TaxID=101571 RepID=UPI000B1170BF|nr:hypothetical protein [Burkholderia ubonensis]
MGSPNTNLAAEYFVLSALHRLGIEAYLTLGNKKGCDIVAIREDQTPVRVEVKGVAGSYDWRAGNLDIDAPGQHCLVLVSFEHEIADLTRSPVIWVLPFDMLPPFVRRYTNAVNISRAEILAFGAPYRNAWHHISG